MADEPLADDFDTEDFEPDQVIFPYAPPQQWVVLNGDVTADELAVYTFIMAHLNPWASKFETTPGRRRIAERFEKSMDWVDKRLNKLIEHGALTKDWMWWIDASDHSRGRSVNQTDSYGAKRSQAPNRYRVKLQPAAGAAYPGPIKVGEYYRPDRIRKRIQENRTEGETPGEGGAATQRPGSDQGEQQQPEPEGGPPHSGPGGAATQRPGGPPHSGPKEHGGKDHGEEKDHGGEPFGNTQKVRQKVYGETAGHSACGETKQSDLGSNPLTARARTKAGPAACQAFKADPSITQADLATVIRQEQPQLSQGQAAGRAAALLDREHQEAHSARPAAS